MCGAARPPLLPSVPPRALAVPSTGRCGSLRPRSQTAGTPKLKLARTRDTAELRRHRGDATRGPAGHSSRGRSATPGWSLTPAARPARGPPTRSSRGPGWKGPQGAETRRARGAPQAGWAPGARRARAGMGMGRGRGRESRDPEAGRDRREGREGWGRRLQTPRTETARRGPAALTHLRRTRRRSWLLSVRFPRGRLPGDVIATTAIAGPEQR